jgi:hypothetical protein
VIEVREIDVEGAGDGVCGTGEGRGGVMPDVGRVGKAEAFCEGADAGGVCRSDGVVLFYVIAGEVAAGMGEALAAA